VPAPEESDSKSDEGFLGVENEERRLTASRRRPTRDLSRRIQNLPSAETDVCGGLTAGVTRTVVVGGVGPTLGESIARRFAREGDSVALWARSESFTAALADDLTGETSGEALAVPVDVTDPDAVTAGAAAVRDAFGPVESDPEDFLRTARTVGYVFALVVDELLPDLRDGGTLIYNSGDHCRWVPERTAERLAPEGVHVVHTFVDGRVDAEDVPDGVPEEKRADPDAVAEEFLRLVEQDRDVWSSRVDLRPYGDDAFRVRR
jgi:hypothetical protein